MIIGAAKSGTTSLADSLAKHPEVCFCKEKEPEFFSHQVDWNNKVDQYHSLYDPKPGQLMGEASTSYTMLPETEPTSEYLYQYNKDLKLIYIMRDPVKRLTSHFAHNFVRKRVNRPIEEEVIENPAYISRSSYHSQIIPYIEKFGKDQVLLLIFENFIKDPQATLIQVAKFIGIDSKYYEKMEGFAQKNQTANRKILADGGAGKIFKPLKRIRRYIPENIVKLGLSFFGNSIELNPTLTPELEKTIYNKLKPEIEGIEKLVGHQLLEWHNY